MKCKELLRKDRERTTHIGGARRGVDLDFGGGECEDGYARHDHSLCSCAGVWLIRETSRR
jgi:hypothetical protein